MRQVIATRYGTMECLSSDSVVSTSLLRYGEWAQSELDLILSLVRPGAVVIDVGAFLGTHTLALASVVGPTGRVYSFEPRSAIRSILDRNVQRNALQQVTVYPCALGAQPSNLVMPLIDIESESNFGGLALNGNVMNGQLTETIRIERLDDLVKGPVDFIKLDAEGMEPEVLAGATSLLVTSQPILLVECNDLEHGSRILHICLDLGYEVYGVLSPAFNPANLCGEIENIFGDASEASLVALPSGRAAALEPSIKAQLAPMHKLDDLALLLLHKPQYPVEVLASTSSASALGIDYPSALARSLRDEVAELRAAVSGAFDRAQAAEQRAENAQHAAAVAQVVVDSLQAKFASTPRRVGWVYRLQKFLRSLR